MAERVQRGRIVAAGVAVFLLLTAAPASARLTIAGASKGDFAGSSVANAGDVNGDGIDDALVGAYLAGRRHSGSAYVVFGSRSSRRVDLRRLGSHGFGIRGPGKDAYAGYSVAGGRDVNGDGLADVVVGAPRLGVSFENYGGGAFVVFGKRDSRPVSLAALGGHGFLIHGFWLGRSVGLAPDMNGDGRAGGGLGAGHTVGWGPVGDHAAGYVVFGSASSDRVDAKALGSRGFEIDDPDMDEWTTVAGLGDVNGDGRGDVAVGVPVEHWPPGPGVAYVLFGKGDGATADVSRLGGGGFALRGNDARARLGAAVADAGDTNGDGLHDVLVGAPRANGPHGNETGAAYVAHGSRAPHDLSADDLGSAGFRVDGLRGGDVVLHGGEQLGYSVASAGDVNGDGRSDLLLGAPFASGRAYVVTSPGGAAGSISGGRALDELG